MSLPWVRLDAGFYANPKVVGLVDDRQHQALNLYVFALAYSGQHGLGGYIPKSALRVLHATPKHATQLVDAGLWHETEGGWDINGWTEFQPSPDEVLRRRQRAKWLNCRRHHGPDCTCSPPPPAGPPDPVFG